MNPAATEILTDPVIDPAAIPAPVPADHQGIFEPVHMPVETVDPDLIYEEAEAAKVAEAGVDVTANAVPSAGYYEWQEREIRVESLKYAAMIGGGTLSSAVLLRNATEIESYLRTGDVVGAVS